jgi:DNA-binding beta-propeller fold protein YncE
MAACVSCRKDEPEPAAGFENGVYILNEGAFMAGNASISHLADDGTLTIDPFLEANGFPLGDVLQSFTAAGDKGYAVLNGSGKIEVFQLSDFRHVTAMEGFSYPRDIEVLPGNRAAITNGSATGEVKVMDLTTYSEMASIAVGQGPEGMAVQGANLFVCNSGGWLIDSTVTVIDLASLTTAATLQVAHRPVQAVTDSSGRVWILCQGQTYYDADWNVTGHSPAYVFVADGESLVLTDSVQVGVLGDHPLRMAISGGGDRIFIENNGLYSIDTHADEITPVLVISGQHQGIGVHPVSGDVWTAGVADFVSPSLVRRHSATGAVLKEWHAGIGTSGFYFR